PCPRAPRNRLAGPRLPRRAVRRALAGRRRESALRGCAATRGRLGLPHRSSNQVDAKSQREPATTIPTDTSRAGEPRAGELGRLDRDPAGSMVASLSGHSVTTYSNEAQASRAKIAS